MVLFFSNSTGWASRQSTVCNGTVLWSHPAWLCPCLSPCLQARRHQLNTPLTSQVCALLPRHLTKGNNEPDLVDLPLKIQILAWAQEMQRKSQMRSHNNFSLLCCECTMDSCSQKDKNDLKIGKRIETKRQNASLVLAEGRSLTEQQCVALSSSLPPPWLGVICFIGHGAVWLKVGLDDPAGLFQPEQFCDSMIPWFHGSTILWFYDVCVPFPVCVHRCCWLRWCPWSWTCLGFSWGAWPHIPIVFLCVGTFTHSPSLCFWLLLALMESAAGQPCVPLNPCSEQIFLWSNIQQGVLLSFTVLTQGKGTQQRALSKNHCW